MNRYKKISRNPYRKTNLPRMTRRRGTRRGMMKLYRAPRNKIGGDVATLKVEISVPVYLYSAVGPSFAYSFSSTSVVLNSTIFTDTTYIGNEELRRMINSYLYCKVNGVAIKFVRSINAAINTIYQLPAIYANIVTGLSAGQRSNITRQAVAQADSSYEVQTLNTVAESPSKYYGFTEPFFSESDGLDNPVGMYCNSLHMPTIYLLLGSLDVPQQSDVTNSPKVGQFECIVYLSFTKRMVINNV